MHVYQECVFKQPYLFKVPINCVVKDTLTVCFVHHDKSIYLFWKKEILNRDFLEQSFLNLSFTATMI